MDIRKDLAKKICDFLEEKFTEDPKHKQEIFDSIRQDFSFKLMELIVEEINKR